MPRPFGLHVIDGLVADAYRDMAIRQLSTPLLFGMLAPRPDPEPTDDTTYDFWTGRYTPEPELDDWEYDH